MTLATFTASHGSIRLAFGMANTIVLHRDGMEAVISAMAGMPTRFVDETGTGYHVVRTPDTLLFAGEPFGSYHIPLAHAAKLEDMIETFNREGGE